MVVNFTDDKGSREGPAHQRGVSLQRDRHRGRELRPAAAHRRGGVHRGGEEADGSEDNCSRSRPFRIQR